MSLYHRASTCADALSVIAAASAARPLVGGTDLLVGLRHHTVEPDVIVDLKTVTDLPPPIEVTDDGLDIGPTLTLGELVTHPVVQRDHPALVEAARAVGSVAIRNRASLLGNLCNGSPAADTAPPLLVSGALVTIDSLEGRRTVPLSRFFLGNRRTLCAPGELVTRLHVPRPARGHGAAFLRLTRRRGVDLATVSVAAGLHRDGRLLLAMGAVGPRPLLTEVEPRVDIDDEPSVSAALDAGLAVATPISDVRAGQQYRTAMVRVLARRALLAAAARRAPGEMVS